MTVDTSRFSFVADALNGSGLFRPSVTYSMNDAGELRPSTAGRSVLVPHPRERDIKFAYRSDLAWYENHLRAACQRFAGYLVKAPPMREIANQQLQAFANDCNWRGDHLDVFWQSFMINAKARGSMLLLVEGQHIAADSVADQLDSRAFPYLIPLLPEDVIKFKTDWRGRMALVEYGTTREGNPAVKGWDATRWWIRIGEKIVEEGQHGLGVCPVLAFTESGDYPHIGDFAQIADLSRRLVNAWSELTELQRQQGFAVLHYQVPLEQHDFNSKQVAEEIGTNNMLIHRGEAPGYIAPPEGPTKAYFEEIANLEKAIERIALTVDVPNERSQQSGIALTLRFQSLNAALVGFARRMEDLERRTWEMVCRWLGLPVERVTVEWAKDYSISDIKIEMETLGAMQMSGMPQEVISRQQKRIVALQFSTATDEDLNALMDAIDEPEAEINGRTGQSSEEDTQ